ILLADRYFGIRGPTEFSQGFIAARYEQTDITHVRPEWRKEFEEWRSTFERTHRGATGGVMLGYWARNAFRHVFLNPFANTDISDRAVQSTHEFVRHVQEQIDAAKQRGAAATETETVLSRMLVAQRGNPFWSDDRIRNALLELVVGGIETVS